MRHGARGSDHVGPHGAGLHAQQAALAIGVQHLLHPGHVQLQPALRKLLAAHGVAATADGQRQALLVRACQGGLHIGHRVRPEHMGHLRGVELAVDVVERVHAAMLGRPAPRRAHGHPEYRQTLPGRTEFAPQKAAQHQRRGAVRAARAA